MDVSPKPHPLARGYASRLLVSSVSPASGCQRTKGTPCQSERCAHRAKSRAEKRWQASTGLGLGLLEIAVPTNNSLTLNAQLPFSGIWSELSAIPMNASSAALCRRRAKARCSCGAPITFLARRGKMPVCLSTQHALKDEPIASPTTPSGSPIRGLGEGAPPPPTQGTAGTAGPAWA